MREVRRSFRACRTRCRAHHHAFRARNYSSALPEVQQRDGSALPHPVLRQNFAKELSNAPKGRAEEGRAASSDRRRAPGVDGLLATAEASLWRSHQVTRFCTSDLWRALDATTLRRTRRRLSADQVATSATGRVDPECPVPMRFGALLEGPLLAESCRTALADRRAFAGRHGLSSGPRRD
jgi:hypothetical protein